MSRHDPLMKKYLEDVPKNVTYLSHQIQNEILQSILNVVQRTITSQICNKPISIISDDTTDAGHHEQKSVVVRYFDMDLFVPVERFICLKRILSVNSNAMFSELSEIISTYNLNWNDVVSVCFDGASTISGCISGVQTKCKEENSRIMYVHCYAHCLNLVLVDACTTRRNIPMIFKEIMQPVLQLINKVSKMLQTENYDLLSGMANAKALRLALLDMRTEEYFKKIFDTSVSICKELDVPIPLINKRKISSHIDSNKTQFVQETKESELRISAFYPIIDVIVHSIDERFSQDTIQAIHAVDSLLNMDISQTELSYLSKTFQCDIEKLKIEVRLIKNNSTIPNKDSFSNKSKIHE